MNTKTLEENGNGEATKIFRDSLIKRKTKKEEIGQ
jgi:hypothetical protein